MRADHSDTWATFGPNAAPGPANPPQQGHLQAKRGTRPSQLTTAGPPSGQTRHPAQPALLVLTGGRTVIQQLAGAHQRVWEEPAASRRLGHWRGRLSWIPNVRAALGIYPALMRRVQCAARGVARSCVAAFQTGASCTMRLVRTAMFAGERPCLWPTLPNHRWWMTSFEAVMT